MRSHHLALLASALLALPTPAQPPAAPFVPVPPQAPTLALPTPFGATRGTTVEVTLTGTNLADPVGVGIDGAIKATILEKDAAKLRVKLEIPADAPVGMRPIRVATKHGVSNARPFCIDDLPAVAVPQPPRTQSTALPLAVPAVVAGRIDPETSEFYRVAVKPGQRLAVEVLARRLGSALDPLVMVHDAKSGRELPSLYSDDAPGTQADARFVHTFKEAGDYVIEVRDSTYRGGPDHFYRLRVGDFPAVIAPMPLAVKRGAKATVAFAGPDLDGVTGVAVSAPTDPTIEAVAVTAKGSRPASGWPVSLLLSDHDEVLEQEPNDPSKPMRVTIPVGISGQFQPKSDLDGFAFAAKKGAKYVVEALTQELLSPADVYLMVKTAKGAEVAKSDPTKGARIEYAATEDGDLTVVVEHLNYLHGPNEVYRLTIGPAEPDFDVTLGADRVEVAAGMAGAIPVQAIARRDYAGPIELSVVGSPRFRGAVVVTATAAAAPNLPLAVLPIAPTGNVEPGVYEVRVLAKATVANRAIATFGSTANAVRATMSGLAFPPRELTATVVVAVTEPPVKFAVAPLEVARGTTATLAVTRNDPAPTSDTAHFWKRLLRDLAREALHDEVALSVLGLPPTVKAEPKPLAKGATKAEIKLTPSEKAPLGPLGVVVVGKAKVAGKDYAVSVAVPVTVVVPFELKATAPAKLKPGAKVKLTVTALRKGGFAGPIDVEVKGLPAGVSAAKGQIVAGKDAVEIEVTATAAAAVADKKDATVAGVAVGHTATTPAFAVVVEKKQ